MDKPADIKKRSHAGSVDSRSAYEAVKAGTMGPPPRPTPRTPPIKRVSSGSAKSTLTKAKKSVRVKPTADEESRASPTPVDRSVNSPQSVSEQSPRPSRPPSSASASVAAQDTNVVPQKPAHTIVEEDAESAWTPREPLEKFASEQLLQRYEAQMQSHIDEEHQVWQRIGRLNQLLEAWATTGSAKEIERSRKRLRTRVAYVHHQESKLERSQAHYTNVRKALQSALEKLDIDEPSYP